MCPVAATRFNACRDVVFPQLVIRERHALLKKKKNEVAAMYTKATPSLPLPSPSLTPAQQPGLI